MLLMLMAVSTSLTLGTSSSTKANQQPLLEVVRLVLEGLLPGKVRRPPVSVVIDLPTDELIGAAVLVSGLSRDPMSVTVNDINDAPATIGDHSCPIFVLMHEDYAEIDRWIQVLGELARSSCLDSKMKLVLPLAVASSLRYHKTVQYFFFEHDVESTALHGWTKDGPYKICQSSDFSLCHDHRRQVSGATMKATYEFWKPFFFYDNGKGSFDGLFYRIIALAASRLNVTVDFIRNAEPGMWGSKASDGSWSGLIGMLHDGLADVSCGGMTLNAERREVVDYSINVVSLEDHLLSRRPSRYAVSWENYLNEFDRYIWLALVIVSGVTMAIFALVLAHSGTPGTGSLAVSVVLRGLVGRGTHVPACTLSTKTVIMVNLLFSTVVLISYRSCLNAFLAVVIPSFDIHDLEDVVVHEKTLTFWGGGVSENFLSSSSPGSVAWKLHQAAKGDENARFKDYSKGVENVMRDERYVMMAPPKIIGNYPCDVVKTPTQVWSRITGFTWQRGSRFAVPFDREIVRMRQDGTLDKLMGDYLSHHDEEACSDGGAASGLSFSNVFSPFAILAAGASVGIIFGFTERLAEVAKSFFTGRQLPTEAGRGGSELLRAKWNKVEAVFSAGALSRKDKMRMLENIFVADYKSRSSLT